MFTIDDSYFFWISKALYNTILLYILLLHGHILTLIAIDHCIALIYLRFYSEHNHSDFCLLPNSQTTGLLTLQKVENAIIEGRFMFAVLIDCFPS